MFNRLSPDEEKYIQTIPEDKSVIRNFRITAIDGKGYDIKHYANWQAGHDNLKM